MMSFRKSQRKRVVDSRESGMVLVLVAIFSIVLLALLALAVGLTFVSTQDQRLTTITNVGALAAIDHYVSNGEAPSEHERRSSAVERANYIISKNKVLGVANDLGELGLPGDGGAAGSVYFGRYFRSDPRGNDPNNHDADDCDGLFPCFLEVDEDRRASAILIDHQNQPSNPLVAPFTSLLGAQNFTVRSRTATTLVNTCIAHLLDVSFSTVVGTHKPYRPTGSLCPASYPVCCEATSDEPACALLDMPSDGSSDDFFDGLSYTPNPFETDGAFLIARPFIALSDNNGHTNRFSSSSIFAVNASKVLENPTMPSQGLHDAFSLEHTPDAYYWLNLPDKETSSVSSVFTKSDYVFR
ncbi:MAG: hypothetical protein KDD55_03430, partial [Bdellovibrionales bacterium]|nr:hypothetical protein [Bdellovibrionales bacterium]